MPLGLGDLEAAVMNVLWRADSPFSVREVQDRLAPDRRLAYTTVMTVLTNLHSKGWVQREMHERAYQYVPTETAASSTARVLREVLDASGSTDAALLEFVRTMTAEETAVLSAALNSGS